MGLLDRIRNSVSALAEFLEEIRANAGQAHGSNPAVDSATVVSQSSVTGAGVSKHKKDSRKNDSAVKSTGRKPDGQHNKYSRDRGNNNDITFFKPVKRKYTTRSGDTFMPLWQKAGWMVNVHDSNLYIGTYRFFDKRRQKEFRWEGAIQNSPHEMKVFIKDPPAKLQNHQHWQCFNHKGDGWYLVHFLYDLNGLDDAILNVQRLIAEAYWFC